MKLDHEVFVKLFDAQGRLEWADAVVPEGTKVLVCGWRAPDGQLTQKFYLQSDDNPREYVETKGACV